MERKMFYNANPELFIKAKQLRLNMTYTEKLLWEELKENKLGFRFKSQHPIDIFIADFYCHALKLVIEIDGEIHETKKEYDWGRTSELEKYSITVLRFTNQDVITNIHQVMSTIKKSISNLKT